MAYRKKEEIIEERDTHLKNYQNERVRHTELSNRLFTMEVEMKDLKRANSHLNEELKSIRAVRIFVYLPR